MPPLISEINDSNLRQVVKTTDVKDTTINNKLNSSEIIVFTQEVGVKIGEEISEEKLKDLEKIDKLQKKINTKKEKLQKKYNTYNKKLNKKSSKYIENGTSIGFVAGAAGTVGAVVLFSNPITAILVGAATGIGLTVGGDYLEHNGDKSSKTIEEKAIERAENYKNKAIIPLEKEIEALETELKAMREEFVN